MSSTRSCLVFAAVLAVHVSVAEAQLTKCPPDSAKVGTTCVDLYEASIWSIDPANASVIRNVQKGKAKLSDLTKAGATQLGSSSDDYGSLCVDSGSGCRDVYAVSISGVMPSRYLTWLQAAAVCRNAGKRLPTNGEWQAAALGTPDPGGAGDGIAGCKTNDASPPPGGQPVSTGSAANCTSDVGVYDMVGNVWEWVGDWNLVNGGQQSSTVVARGGSFHDGALAAFAVSTISSPENPPYSAYDAGVRCVR
jgi:formylglycine-generating enzyme required for sulfatase activity